MVPENTRKVKNVLILNGGTNAGILISRCINMSVDYHAMSASTYVEHSRFVYEDYYPGLPSVLEEGFVEALNKLIDEKDISFIIPSHDTIALVLMENAQSIHATVVCSPLETAYICRYKSATFRKLADCAFTPKWCFLEKNCEIQQFPLFAKPDDGQGGKGAFKVENAGELAQADWGDRAYVVCEYLPGTEYTVDCFTKANGELIFVNPRCRAEVTNGQSSLAVSAPDDGTFREMAEAINQRIRFRGYWYFQVKEDANGVLKLLEVSARFAGTFAHAHASGVNLPLLALADFSGKDVSAVGNSYAVKTGKAFIDRYLLDITYDRVYVDYDDTITAAGGDQVNTLVLAWLHQCKNAGKQIVLISRHAVTKENTLAEDMERLSIAPGLFDQIIELRWEDHKEDYMDNELPSVFMDNSFAERKAVAHKWNMPVFDVCHVDCLYDWRRI